MRPAVRHRVLGNTMGALAWPEMWQLNRRVLPSDVLKTGQFLRFRSGVVVVLAICDVDNHRRVRVGMVGDPGLQQLVRHFEGFAHRRAIVHDGFQPHGELDGLVNDAARAVVHFFGALFHAGRVVGDFADGHEELTRKRPTERGNHFRAVADDADHIIVVDALAFGALDDKVLQQAVDGVRKRRRPCACPARRRTAPP